MNKQLIIVLMICLSKLSAQSNQEERILNLLNNADLSKMEFLKEAINDNVPLGDSNLTSTLCDIYFKSSDEKIKRGCALTISSLVPISSDQYGKPTPRVLEILIDKMVDTTFTFESPHIQNLGQFMLMSFSILAPNDVSNINELDKYQRAPYDYLSIQMVIRKWYLSNKNKMVWDSRLRKFKLN